MKTISAVDVSVVVDDIVLLPPTSLSADPGQTVVVRGQNGSGKSTLLRVIAGVRAPTSGTAEILGKKASARDASLRRQVSAMIGLPPMARDLTVRDHIALVAASWFDDPREAASTTNDVMQSLGIDSLGLRFPHELSSGQTQLFSLCLVLARPFDILILDEPEQRLDGERIASVANVLRTHADRGATLVVATHNDVLAAEIGDLTLELTGAE